MIQINLKGFISSDQTYAPNIEDLTYRIMFAGSPDIAPFLIPVEADGETYLFKKAIESDGSIYLKFSLSKYTGNEANPI